ncbi:MAG: hypothetical protein JSU83_22745 [Deltaproteobacteria bacterium]|nr:MAG: hypothetical protein JSU83_22745 [Deltaproteobacteria bacterium]
MKKRSIILYCILIILIGNCVYAADIGDGFSGLKWGTDRSTVENLLKVSQKENVGYFIKPDEVYIINHANVGQVFYGFYQNKFFAALFRIKDKEDFGKIKEYMISGYGTPRAQLRVNQTVYIWEYGDIKIKMKLYEKDGTHKLAYYYTPLYGKLNESRLEENFEQSIKLVPKE